MSPKKATRLYSEKKDLLKSLIKDVDTLLGAYYVEKTTKEFTNEEVEKLSGELIAAEDAFDAAYAGLPKINKKTQEERDRLRRDSNNQGYELHYALQDKRLVGLHANVREGLNQLLGQLSLEEPPPADQLEAVEGKLESARLVMREAKELSDQIWRFLRKRVLTLIAFIKTFLRNQKLILQIRKSLNLIDLIQMFL